MNSKNHGHFTRALFSFLLVLSILTTTMPPQVAQAAITDASTLDMIASTVSILERIVAAVQEFFGEDSVAQTTSGGNQGNGGNHPYLLFTDGDVETLRANANDPTSFNYSYWQILKNKCAGDIGTIGGTFSASGPPSVNSITNGARDLRDLAICSVLHSDAATRDRYITAVRQELVDMSNWSSWGIESVGGVIYFVGRGYINIAIAYDIAYDSFTTSSQITARTNLEKLFYKEMVNTLYYNDEDWGTRSLNERLGNHNVHAYTSMLAIGLAIKYANIPSLSVSIQGIIDKGRAGVDNILLFNYDRDGAAFEDINYHPETVARYAYMAFEIYKNVLGNDPFQRRTWGGSRPALQGYTDFHSQMLFPWLQTWPSFLDGSVCNQDSNGAVCIANPYLPYILATEHYNDRVAAWYIDRIKSKNKSPNDEEAVFGSLWGNKLTPQTPSAAGRPAVFQSYNAPKNSANSDAYGAGYTIMRTGFEDEKDIQLVSRAIDSAAFHGHSNHGSFILNAFGTQFITDYFNAYGRDGGGYTDNLNYAFQQSGKGHNSVLACNNTLSVCEGSAYQHDNPAPNRRDIYFEQISTIPTAFSNGQYDLVTMDLTRAYQLNSENANVTDAKRHFVFIREGGRKGYFVVIDDFSSSTGYRWQQRYHYAENAGGVRSKTFVTPSITDNNRYQLTKVGATSPKLFIQQIYPTSGTTASIESRPNQYDTSETLGRWIQTTTNNASTRFVRVSLMYPSENGAAPTVSPTISGSKITVAVDGRSVTYDQSAKTVSVNTGDTTPTTYACSDGIENDSPADGLIDYPADPGCTSATDNDEYNLPPSSPVTCTPATQSVNTGQSASFTATGGGTSYSWSAPGGSTTQGTGSSFSTTYSSTGTKTVTVSSNGVSDSCSVSVTTAPPTTGSGIVPGRIAISSDGNHHDFDDVLATAETVSLLAKTGQSSKLVYYGYSDHHWVSSATREAQMEDSGLETARIWNNAGAANFTLSNFYSATARNSSGNPIPNQSALNKLVAEINASSASDPLWIIAAGPMDIVGRAMNAANSTSRQYVHLISHSNWNNEHSDSPDSSEAVQHTGWTWAEMQSSFGSAKFHYLNDQNGGLNDDYSAYTWLRDSSDSKLRWIWCRSQGTKCSEFSSYTAGAGKGTFDDSDTGMAYWLITGGYKNTGDTNSRTNTPSTIYGDSNATPAKLRSLFTQPQCNNLIDDDGDGAIDTADGGCSGTSDTSEGGTSSGGDTSNPSVNISAPAANATLSGTVTVSANASDNVGVTRVEFYRGTTLISSDTSSPYAASWNTTSLANGSYSLTARAFDAAGNSATSAGISVTVNNTVATPVACTPSSQSVNTGVSASFTAANGNGTYSWTATGGSPASGSGSSFSTTYSSTGTKTVTVTSNSTSASCTVTVTTPPVTNSACGNTTDDDGDGRVDMNDPGCISSTDTSESNPTVTTKFAIGDTVSITNADGLNVRSSPGGACVDSSCVGQSWGATGTVRGGPKYATFNSTNYWWWDINFANSTTDGWAIENGLTKVSVVSACADGIDNDSPADGLIDYPADPGCTSATDNDEYNTPPVTTVSCTPATQSVNTGQSASFTATGGGTSYSWSAPGGSTTQGTGSSFSTTYSSTGTKTVTVSSNGVSDSCTVTVSTPPATATCDTSYPTDKFHACYFDGITAPTTAASILTQTDETTVPSPVGTWAGFSKSWSTGVITPTTKSDSVSAVWRGRINFSPGTYTFTTQSDDGVRLVIDGGDYLTPLIENWTIHSNTTNVSEPIFLSGWRDLRMSWYENDAHANIGLSWTKAADPIQAQCADGIDNDSPADGLIDYPSDPGCSAVSDNDEYNEPPVATATVTGLELVNADINDPNNTGVADILLLTNNSTVNLNAYPNVTNLSVRALTSGTPSKVVFTINGAAASAEEFAPYAIYGDNDGNYINWGYTLGTSYTISATPYDANNVAGTPFIRTFTLTRVTTTACSDGVDNDNDGRIDMNDYGCGIATDTSEYNPTNVPTRFSPGSRVIVDNVANIREYAGDATSNAPQQPIGAKGTVREGPKFGVVGGVNYWYWRVDFDTDPDGWTADPALDPLTTAEATTACSDGADNDGDGKIDLLDTGCVSSTDTDEFNTIAQASAACADGADNDGDGKVDLADLGCSSSSDTDEYNSPVAACSDGFDNDSDGKVDYPADFGCTGSTDTDESNPVSTADIKAKSVSSGTYGNGPVSIVSGTAASVQWTSSNASECTVTSNPSTNTWTGLTGTQTTSAITETTIYALLCYQFGAISASDAVTITTYIPVACADGADNDSDGAIDYPADSGCISATDDNEVNPQISDVTAPTISNVSATSPNGDTLIITWTTNEPATSRVAYGTNGALGNIADVDPRYVTSHSMTLSGLNRKTTYSIQVSSVDGAGNIATAPMITAQTAARLSKSPNVKNLTASSGSIVLRWQNPSDYEYWAGTIVLRDTDGFINIPSQSLALYSGTASEYRDNTAVNGVTYYYTVYTFDDQGTYSDPEFISYRTTSGTTSGDNVTDYIAPRAPTAFSVIKNSDGTVTLRWANPGDSDFSRVRILRKSGSAPISATGADGSTIIYEGPITAIVDTDLPGTNLFYAAYALDVNGNVSLSSIGTPATTPTTTSTSANQTTPGVCSGVTPGIAIVRWMVLGARGEDVRALQKYLNKIGHIIATSGPGSPGQETDFFGGLTDQAVKKFQCERLGVCSGNALSTGYGGVGPRTRAALAQQVTTTQCTGTGSIPSGQTSTSTPAQIEALQQRLNELRRQLQILLGTTG